MVGSTKRLIGVRHIATHEQAMQITRGMKGIMPIKALSDEMIWGTAALKDAVSWQHIDDEGFGTVVTNMVGIKYWVLARRRHTKASERNGDSGFGSAKAFGQTLRPTSAYVDLFEHEGVLLEPGSVL